MVEYDRRKERSPRRGAEGPGACGGGVERGLYALKRVAIEHWHLEGGR